MPIYINSATFTDVFGNDLSFYKSNTVDQFQVKFNVTSLIRMTSVGNPLTLDPSLNQVLSPSISWIEEGFRVGDRVLVRIHTSGGPTIAVFFTQIVYVDDVMCDFTAMGTWYNLSAGQFVTMIAFEPAPITLPKARASLDVLFNHSKNSTPGSEFSLIDAEVTRAIFQGVESMIVGQTIVGDLVGNQSGQFLVSAEIKRNASQPSPFFFFDHDITLTFMNSGMYNQDWFFTSDALKVYMKMLWAAVAGEPFARSESIYTYDGNTGWFNEPHNSSIADSTIVTSATEIDYCIPTTFDIAVDGPLTDIALGSAYRSIDSSYYKNRTFPQQEITMVIATDIINNFFAGITSYLNEFGAGYEILLDNLTQIGSVTTATITITPNAQFQTFMNDRDDGDRLFYLWMKCGNINHLVFADQLTCAPPVGGPLIMIQDFGYLDHSQNIESIVGDQTGFIADTEDDVAYLGTFLLDKNQIIESFNVKVEAFNTVTEDDFTLQSATFNFNSVQISGDGRYLLNETQNITTELPTTSVKREAFLVLEPSLDTPTQYGVKIYVPWIMNWRYWLPLTSANVDFYPTQNRNWEQYDNLGNWIVRTELSLIKDGLAFVHDNQIEIKPYDNEADIDSTIDLIQDSSNTVVSVVPVGDLMRIKSTHVNLVGAWGVNTWGMITIESSEQSPRWICSTVVNFDNNTNNPLTPLSGLLIVIDYTSPTTAVLECYFDSNLIDLSNGVSITAKIKDPDTPPVPYEYPIPFGDQARLAYSTMYKLSPINVYNGPIMRVRRSSDDTEMDIPFNNVEIDQVALLNFTGTGIDNNGYIVKLYDQSGDNNHAITSTFAEQPIIVKDGVVLTSSNGLVAGLSDGIANKFTISTQVPALQVFSYFHVFDRISSGVRSVGLATSGTAPFPVAWTAIDRIVDLMSAIANIWELDVTSGNFLLSCSRDNLDNMMVNKDGVATANSPINVPYVPAQSFDQLLERTVPMFTHDGFFQEFILYINDQSANFVTIENNIKNRYNIP